MNNRKEHSPLLTRKQLVSLEALADDAVHDAARSIASLLGVQLEISAVRAHGVPAEKVTDLVGGPEDLAAAIYLKVDGDAPGHAAFVCPHEEALRLVDLLCGLPEGSTQELDDLGTSALQELGNILTSSYLNSLSEHTRLTFLPHPPQLAVDMAYAIVTAILVGSVEASSEAISIVTEFGQETGPLQGFFLYIPEKASVGALLGNIREAA
jgi:chemotaxis protein CheC